MDHGHKIGIDLGGTKTEAVLLDRGDFVVLRKRVPTPRDDGYEAIVQGVHDLVLETAGMVPPGVPFTVGIGIPGSINRETMLVQNANTTCLIGKPLQKDIEKRLGYPVAMENDANCFVYAESRQGAGQGYGLVFGIIMGTGCGGGICIDGRVHRGSHSIAGEWGHYAVDPQGADCYCGNRGCVETKISGSGVENAFYRTYGRRLSMREIVQGYRSGDPQCSEQFNCFLDDFGRCLGGLISVLDPDAVVLGGGLSNIEELYTLGKEQVRRYVFHQDLKTPILRNRLGDSAGVLGAAWLGAQ